MIFPFHSGRLLSKNIAIGSIALVLLCGWDHGKIPSGTVTTTFDPSQTDPLTVLSNGNLTSTSLGSGNPGYFVTRSVANNLTGQFYNEFTFNSIGSCVSGCTSQVIFGIGNANAAEELGVDSNNSIGEYDSGGIVLNSAQVGPAQQTMTVGQTAGLAVDLTNKLAWFRVHGGNWNNTGGCTPANAGCGVSIAALNAGPYFVMASVHNISGVQLTANFGATAYADVAPSGFANWTNPGNGGGNQPYVFNPNAVKAQPFIASLGANTHITQGNPIYTEANIQTDMAYLGIGLIRDYGLDTLNPAQSVYNTLAAAGYKFDFDIASQHVGGCSPSPAATLTTLYGLIDTFVTTYPGAMASAEGINELNNNPSCYVNSPVTNNTTASGNATLHYASTLPALQAINACCQSYAPFFVNQVIVSDLTLLPTIIDSGNAHAAASSPATSQNVVLTINNSAEKLLICTAASGGPVTTITDTQSLSWAKRASASSGATDLEEWTATGPVGGSYPRTDTITVSQTSSASLVIDAFGVIGSTGAFDGSAVTGTSDPLTITTTHANTVVIGCYRQTGNNSSQAAQNFVSVAGTIAGVTGDFVSNLWGNDGDLVEIQPFTSTQSSLSVPLGPNTVGTAQAGIADAVVLTSGAVFPIAPVTTLSTIASTSVTMASNVQGAGVGNGDATRFIAFYNNPAPAIAWQQDIYNKTHGDSHLTGVPVINFTDFPSYGVTGTADYNNQHYYPNQGEQPGWVAGPASDIAGLPQAVTETGYYTVPATGGISQLAQSLLQLNDLFDMYVVVGSKYTYMYELIDEANSSDTVSFHHYGLFDYNNNPKTAATSIKNLVTILTDTGGAFTPGSLTYSISPFPAHSNALNNFGAQALLLQKSNGHFFICVWNEPSVWNGSDVTPPTTSATLTLAATETTVNVYDPQVQSTPINTYSSVSSVPLSIAADQLIIEVIP